MPKLSKLYYITSKGERKINCYNVQIPKKVVEKTNIQDNNIKVYAENNKIIIERD
jgi:antitoxin component of MazEF toxin-antitoxin module